MTYDRWKTTEPDWLTDQGQHKDHATMTTPTDADPSTPTTPPTQAEVDAIHRDLMEADRFLPAMLPTSNRLNDLHRRAAVMIARLERAWLECKAAAGR
jgi:hypothetical protein